ncbi:hypothetical protein [Flavobacterium sp.]|uniref:hypothetical protein n=1 Tax=Flavobacterium sp. TaxID=239 RepID=UPI0011FE84B3|nr:hypothetical protein [Flavobacterium sp.]RZJ72736.1 MAG: hypothetical protein EOO49_03605 [Flavobacterium sp.]
MKQLFWLAILLPIFGLAQKKERIPFQSYDFLKLVHKYYKNIPVIEEGFKSLDLIGEPCFLLTMPNGDLYYLYENNVLKFSSGNTSVDVYQVGENVVMFAVQISTSERQLIYSVNGDVKSRLKG